MFLNRFYVIFLTILSSLPAYAGPQFKDNPIPFTIQVGVNLNVDLHTILVDPASPNLEWDISNTKPSWLELNKTTGILTGTPSQSNVGIHEFTLSVFSGEGADFNHPTRLVVITPPIWNQSPLNLGKQQQDAPFSLDLNSHVSSPSGGVLTYVATSGKPSWLTLSSSGVLSGTPLRADVGIYNGFSFTVTSASTGLSSTVGAFGEVLITLYSPSWKENPIHLSDASEDSLYVKNISSFVNNPEGGLLNFELVNAPSWVLLSSDGVLSGIPRSAQVGSVTLTAHVYSTVQGKLLDGGNTQVVFKVNHVNHAPQLAQPISFTVEGESLAQLNLAPFATDVDGDLSTFTIVSGPSWGSVSSLGLLSGSPQISDEGVNTFNIQISDGNGGTASGVVNVTVIHKNKPPVINSLALQFVVKERETVVKDLKLAVSDFENQALSFSLIDNLSWLTLNADGTLIIKPLFQNIGNHSVRFAVSDGLLSSEGVIKIQVLRDPRAPIWLENPISFEAKINKPFTGSLSLKAKDQDGLPISFVKVSGPIWLSVDPNGLLTGTPSDSDLGIQIFTVQVKNDLKSADAELKINIFDPNLPPIVNSASMNFTVKERETQIRDLKLFVTDPENDNLTFTLLDTLPWVTLSSNGSLTLKPLFQNIGDYTVRIQVSDGKLAGFGSMTIKVVRDPRPPFWLENPIRYQVGLLENFSQSLATKAQDSDGLPLSFTKKSGPNWLNISSDGTISGIPPVLSVGENVFVVSAKNDAMAANATVIITVIDPNHPPVVDSAALNFTMKEREVQIKDLNQFVSDPDGDSLTFTILDSLSWVSLTSEGVLTLKPLYQNIGEVNVHFQVKDIRATVEGIIHIKVLRDPRAPTWLENPIHLSANMNQKMTVNISDKAKDLDGISVTFAKVSGPAWLTVLSNGTVTGTPPKVNLGENSFVISVKNDLLSANADLIVTVTDPNHAPYWTVSPLLMKDASVGKTYAERVESFAKDLDAGDKLTFSKVSGPDWVMITSSGLVIGTPGISDMGGATLIARVSDPSGAYADNELAIAVIDPNRAPRWTADPILMGEVEADMPFNFNLSEFAVDDDGDVLSFKKIIGPAWMTVNLNGTITGTPAKTDLGEFTAVFSTSDGKFTVDVGSFGKVIPKKNTDPVIVANSLNFTIREREVFIENLNQPKYVSDPNQRPLTFTMKESVSWVTLDAAGSIKMSPVFQNIGDYTFTLKVTNDSGKFAEAPLVVHVIRNPRPPTWLMDPIRFTATVGKAFANTVADKVKDLDGLSLTIAKVSGPDWLQVLFTGEISGTPISANLGENIYILKASNDLTGSNVTVIITVNKEGPIVDSIDVTEPVPGAPVENLWVIDGSKNSISLARTLEEVVPDYFRDLNKAQVVSAGLYISTDPKAKKMPVPGVDGTLLINGQNPNVGDDWKARTESIVSKAFCSSKCQSAIWSMFLFQKKLPTLPVYHNGYSMPTVPMEVAFSTANPDKYCPYALKTPQKNYKAADYAHEFMDFYKAEKKSYRISGVLGKSCGSKCCHSEEEVDVADDSKHADEILTKETKGLFKAVKNKQEIQDFFSEYAKTVILRAYIAAKHHVKLSKIPMNPSAISVQLAGVALFGNTGGNADMWRYQASTNEILINWSLIDMSQILAGDKLEIKYQSNQ